VSRLYQYVGPENIRRRAAGCPAGTTISSIDDLTAWMKESKQNPNPAGLVVVTFVVDEQGKMLVADRGSEHVACSGGRPVLSAGEMFLTRSGSVWRVAEVSNQSTGYCPEPESWPAVATALDAAWIEHPGGFKLAVVFRRCNGCGQRNVVRDGWFACGVCGADLPAQWNFATEPDG
jgi:hypothetical protein